MPGELNNLTMVELIPALSSVSILTPTFQTTLYLQVPMISMVLAVCVSHWVNLPMDIVWAKLSSTLSSYLSPFWSLFSKNMLKSLSLIAPFLFSLHTIAITCVSLCYLLLLFRRILKGEKNMWPIWSLQKFVLLALNEEQWRVCCKTSESQGADLAIQWNKTNYGS